MIDLYLTSAIIFAFFWFFVSGYYFGLKAGEKKKVKA